MPRRGESGSSEQISKLAHSIRRLDISVQRGQYCPVMPRPTCPSRAEQTCTLPIAGDDPVPGLPRMAPSRQDSAGAHMRSAVPSAAASIRGSQTVLPSSSPPVGIPDAGDASGPSLHGGAHPRGGGGLAWPGPQFGAPGDEVGSGLLVQADEAVVHQAGQPGCLEQRARMARGADELAMGEGVGAAADGTCSAPRPRTGCARRSTAILRAQRHPLAHAHLGAGGRH